VAQLSIAAPTPMCPLPHTPYPTAFGQSGRCFSLMVTGSTDNCTLTTQPFLEANSGGLLLETPRCGPPVLMNDDGWDMPWQDALGPLHCSQVCRLAKHVAGCLTVAPGLLDLRRPWLLATVPLMAPRVTHFLTLRHIHPASCIFFYRQALARYLSAVMCKPWPQDLRGAVAASRGKLLLELIEALSGRPVPVKVGFPWGWRAGVCARKHPCALLALCIHACEVGRLRPRR
jgi:hypothetical protein